MKTGIFCIKTIIILKYFAQTKLICKLKGQETACLDLKEHTANT